MFTQGVHAESCHLRRIFIPNSAIFVRHPGCGAISAAPSSRSWPEWRSRQAQRLRSRRSWRRRARPRASLRCRRSSRWRLCRWRLRRWTPTPVPPADRPAGLAQETVPAATVPTAPATRQLAAAGARSSCDDLSNSFLAPRCQLGKAGKSRMARTARAAGARAAAISTGGADAGPQPTTVAAAGPAVTANEADVRRSRPSDRCRPRSRSRPRTNRCRAGRSQLPKPRRRRRHPTGSGLFSLLHAPTRTGGGAWAMSW